MRVSAAIKSILHGVTTDNLVNADPRYMAENVNTITRIDEGLTKRPPSERVATMGVTLASDGTEFVKDFVIHDVAYFVVFRTASVEVYREDGVKFVVNDSAQDGYLTGITEENLDLAVQGEVVWLLNRTKSVAMKPDDSGAAEITHSMMFIKGAIPNSTTIWTTAVTVGGVPVTKQYIVPASGIQYTGADSIAKQIALLFNADPNFTSMNRGATLNIIRPDGNYSEITCSTTQGEEQIVIMNGIVDTVADLPRYAYDECVTKVQILENNEKNNLYMRADAIASYDQVSSTPPVWPAPNIDNKSPYWCNFDGGAYTPGEPIAGDNSYLILDSPGSLGGATINRIFLLKIDVGVTDKSQAKMLMNILFNVGQTPSGGEHFVRWALEGNDQFTIHQTYVDANWDSSQNAYWYANQNQGATVGEAWDATDSYDIWLDPDVASGNAGDIVEVRWTEVAKPGIEKELDGSTMPHTLTPTVDAGFTLAAPEWDERSAGDEDSNPTPRFVNKQIEDITVFQDRLSMLSQDEVTMSASQNVYNFFRDTVTQLLSKHPVHIRSTSAQSSRLHHFVFHNRDLLVVAGRQQFKIAGNAPITPQTGSMTLTASYNASETVSPVSIGNSVYIPSHNGDYLHVSKYDGSNENLAPDAADNITQHARKYISGTVNSMAGLPNHGLIFLNDSLGKDIYVCNYDTLVDRTQDKRFAWFKWNDFSDDSTYSVRAIATTKNKLVMALDTSQGLELLEFNIDSGIGDRYIDHSITQASTNTTVDVGTTWAPTLSEVVAIQGEGCPNPGDYVDTVSLTAGVLTLDEDMDGGTVHVGREFTVQLVPNLVSVRDEGGHVNNAANLRIRGFEIRVRDTGIMTATERSPYDTYETQTFTGLVSGSLDAITDQEATTTDIFQVGFKQHADKGTLLIESKSWLPMTITQIDWKGNYTSRGRRF